MTWKEYDRITEHYFSQQSFVMLDDILSKGNVEIKKGEIVKVSRKFRGFTVNTPDGRSISRVNPTLLNITHL